MNKIITLCLGFFLSLFLSSSVFGQFKISGELRPRAEYSHGYKTLAFEDQNASFFTSQRTRLNFDYKSEKIMTRLVVQDVRIWGNQAQLVENEDFATSIHEAWGEVFFTTQLSLKAGRQEVIYDNQRIFGNVDWAQQARSHDMALLKYAGNLNLHLGIAYHENSDRTNNYYFGPDAYKTMQFLWFNKKYTNLNLSVLVLNNGVPLVETDALGNVTDEKIKFSQTFGPYAEYDLGNLKLAGNFYMQTGKDVADNSISAIDFAIDGTYKLTDNVLVFAGYELLSGTAYDEEAGKNKSFAPLYGTNHKFNGFMDYFYVGNHANNVGLNDIHLGGKYTHGKMFGQVKMLMFTTAAPISADAGSYLGTEFDLWFGYKIADEIDLGVGYSQMLASESMELLKGGDKSAVQNWGYVTLTFKPNFFTYEKPIPAN